MLNICMIADDVKLISKKTGVAMNSEIHLSEDENASMAGAMAAKAPAKAALESSTTPRAPLRERNIGEATASVTSDSVTTAPLPPAETMPAAALMEDDISASGPDVLAAKLETMSFRNNALRAANRELESRLREIQGQSTAQDDEIDTLKIQLQDAVSKVRTSEPCCCLCFRFLFPSTLF